MKRFWIQSKGMGIMFLLPLLGYILFIPLCVMLINKDVEEAEQRFITAQQMCYQFIPIFINSLDVYVPKGVCGRGGPGNPYSWGKDSPVQFYILDLKSAFYLGCHIYTKRYRRISRGSLLRNAGCQFYDLWSCILFKFCGKRQRCI